MLYALLCYHDEALVNSWTKEEDEAVLAKRATVTDKLAARGKLGPALRPMPTTATTTVRFGREPLVIDGPFAESKEQLLASTSSIVRRSKRPSSLPARSGAMRPAPSKSARSNCTRLGAKCLGAKCRGAKCRGAKCLGAMWDDHGRLDRRCATIGAPAGGRCAAAVFPRSRPCRRGFSGSLLRALKNWPHNGPPRDPTAWLILVGRNVALDDVRRSSKSEPLPADDKISDLDDAETDLAERLDSSHYRDDVLRLLFICCHPDLPAVQQIALALRVISGLTVKEIARAFLVSESAMEQRITRAKGRVSRADVPFETPGAVERAARLGAVAAMIYLVFNEGYSASGGSVHVRAPLCEEAIRLSRLLLTLFPSEPEIMGLTALVLLQHARTPARLDADGAIVLLQDQDRRLWDRDKIAEGLALIEKAVRHRRPGPYLIQAAIAGVHAHAAKSEDTDWSEIDQLYATLERLEPSPVVTLNRAVAVSKVQGPAAALAMVEPLAEPLAGYFHFFGVKGGLLMQLGRAAEARSRSTKRLRSPIRPPKRRISACISTG